jgi:hypothetical protein
VRLILSQLHLLWTLSLIGDGEKLFSQITHFVGEARANGMKRDHILFELAQWKGIYVPSFYETEIDEASGLRSRHWSQSLNLMERSAKRVERFFVDSLKRLSIPNKVPDSSYDSYF